MPASITPVPKEPAMASVEQISKRIEATKERQAKLKADYTAKATALKDTMAALREELKAAKVAAKEKAAAAKAAATKKKAAAKS